MDLEVEDVEAGERRKPVAAYVPADSRDWLRHHRVELNAMTTPQFIAWLDDKMAAFGNGKLVPPARVLTDDLSEHARGPPAPADHRADPARGRDRGEGRCGTAGDRAAPAGGACTARSAAPSSTSLRPPGAPRSNGSQTSCSRRSGVAAGRRSTTHEVAGTEAPRQGASRRRDRPDRPGKPARLPRRELEEVREGSGRADRGAPPHRRHARQDAARRGRSTQDMHDAATDFQAALHRRPFRPAPRACRSCGCRAPAASRS